MPAFVRPLTITPADIDELGHVNNTVYLRWAQDIATAHWRARATPRLQADFVWVARRHEIEYFSPLLLGDTAEARTWVADAAKGAQWDRFVEIWGLGAGRPAAVICTRWVLLDAVRRRPARMPAEVLPLFAGETGPPPA